MKVRVAVILSGSILVSAAGGLLASLPVWNAAGSPAPIERAPTPELEMKRLAVLASLQSAADGVAGHASRLELLAGLMAEVGRRSARAPDLVTATSKR